MIKVKKARTAKEKEASFQLRIEVFVHEQKVPMEDEIDEFEEISRHFIAENTHGNIVGAARWRTTGKGIKLERFAVKNSHRGQGVGSALVRAVMADIDQEPSLRDQLRYLHAQVEAVSLYEKFGFEKHGEAFDECGIMHYLMKK